MKKLLLTLIVLTTIVSCATNQEVLSSKDIKEIYPLQVGNNWKFVDEYGDFYFAEVLSKNTIDGKEWYQYTELDEDEVYYVNNSSKGQVELDLETGEEVLVLPYPVRKEKVYSQFGVVSRVTPNVEVTVKAGTFNTYKYDFSVDNPESPIILWFAPGIGLVKNVYEGMVYELVEYNLVSHSEALYSQSNQKCNKIEDVITDTYVNTMATILKDAFTEEKDWSEEESTEYLNKSLKQSFHRENLDDYYQKFSLKGFFETEVLTVPVIASYSKAICNDPSLAEVKEYEKKLAYCNSAASRSGSEDEAVKRKAIYDCILDGLN